MQDARVALHAQAVDGVSAWLKGIGCDYSREQIARMLDWMGSDERASLIKTNNEYADEIRDLNARLRDAVATIEDAATSGATGAGGFIGTDGEAVVFSRGPVALRWVQETEDDARFVARTLLDMQAGCGAEPALASDVRVFATGLDGMPSVRVEVGDAAVTIPVPTRIQADMSADDLRRLLTSQ